MFNSSQGAEREHIHWRGKEEGLLVTVTRAVSVKQWGRLKNT